METKKSIIDFLLRRKYGSLAPHPPPITNWSRLGDINTFKAAQEGRELIEVDRAIFDAMPIEELRRLQAEVFREDAEKQKQLIDALPFNQPRANVRAAHWAKFPTWTLEEAVAISLGKDPAVVTYDEMTKVRSATFKDAWERAPFAIEYRDRWEILRRAYAAGEIELDRRYKSFNLYKVKPATFLVWVADTFGKIPADVAAALEARGELINKAASLEAAVAALTAERDDLKNRLDTLKAQLPSGSHATSVAEQSKPMGPKERNNLLRIIRALDVMGKLPDRGPAASILKQLQELGFSGPGEDTIRKAINAARELETD